MFLFQMSPLPVAEMTSLADQASKLLDFNQKLDISLLDSVVTCMYVGQGQEVSMLCLHLSMFLCIVEAIEYIYGEKKVTRLTLSL